MKKISILFVFSLLLLACNSNENKVEETVNSTTEVADHKSVVPTDYIAAEITGMSCVKGCGSSIRKELYSLGGVSKVEYDFEEERESNGIKIYFDEAQISQDEIILALTTMDEHKYTVSNQETTKIQK